MVNSTKHTSKCVCATIGSQTTETSNNEESSHPVNHGECVVTQTPTKVFFTFDVLVEREEWHNLPFKLDDYIKSIIYAVLQQLDILNTADIMLSFLLTDDKKLRKLNKQYRDKDCPTNVLAFPYTEVVISPLNESSEQIKKQQIVGDIAISYERIYAESVEATKPFQEYLAHIIVHGILHLAGYNHKKPKERDLMEGLECTIMRSLNYTKPL